jgi:hypothetical protein
MSKKPYIYEHLEWLEIFQRKDWNDPTVNPDDLAEYSELQRPYALPDGEDSYPAWEWTWPDINFPDIPPIVKPDPVDNICNVEASCAGVGVIGPDEMECEDCYSFTSIHVIVACEISWWMALGSWEITDKAFSSGDCWLRGESIIFGTVCCDEDTFGSFTIKYNGPLECTDSKQVLVTCGDDCCEALELYGADTVSAGSMWVGTIIPPCPIAECEVISNSGCTFSCLMNESGSLVTVMTGGGDCGAFTVTVTREPDGIDCEGEVATKGVRIIDGAVSWHHDESFGGGCDAGDDCGGGGVTWFNDWCILGEYKYGGFDPRDRNPCQGTWLVQCTGGGASCTCSGGGDGPPPCPVHGCGCSGSYCCCRWSWWRCDWTCACDP